MKNLHCLGEIVNFVRIKTEKMIMVPGKRVIAFDADDTLWENEPLFRGAEKKWAEMLRDYGTLDELSDALYAVEDKNMELLGYGAKAFTLSLFETTLKLTGGNVTGEQISGILDAGYGLLHNPATPLEGVEDTLRKLHESGKYYMIVLTKGDLLDQEKKLQRSGLEKYFDRVEIVSNKTGKEYFRLCSELGITPEELTMVGNSLKSDIKPVVDLGGRGIFIPYHITWAHEHIDDFDHPAIVRIKKFSQLLDIL